MKRPYSFVYVLVFLLASTYTIFVASLSDLPAQESSRSLPTKLIKPNDVLHAALTDATQILDPEIRCSIRYLSLHNIPLEERINYIRIVDFVCNSISTRNQIIYVQIVPNTDYALLRLQIDQYNWSHDVWENLGKKGSGPVRSVKKLDQPDPYFHQVLQKQYAPVTKREKKVFKGYDQYNRPVYETVEEEDKGTPEVKVELVHAPWLDQSAVVNLALQLKTDFPILRADWFISNVVIAPAYYEFLGIKTLEDYQKLVRFRKADRDLAIKGVVSDSLEVALHQRAALYTPTSLGAYWETFDYFTSVGDDDLLADLLKERRDASEFISNLPNRLQVYALANGQDKIIDFADPNVAIDSKTSWKNKLVWSGYSCMTCHVEGMKDVADEVRVLSRPPYALLAKKKTDFKKVVDLFSTQIEEPIDLSKALYKKAVYLATRGLTVQQNATLLQRYFLAYQQKNLDLNDAAMEVGCHPKSIAKVLRVTENPDHTLTQLLAGRPVRRDQWEAIGFSQLATITVNAPTEGP